jgi:hypothetical protein
MSVDIARPGDWEFDNSELLADFRFGVGFWPAGRDYE